jgi:sulfate transport system substrate-binding protein
MRRDSALRLLAAPLLAGAVLGTYRLTPGARAEAPPTLLHVSYDATRELYRDVNAAFAARWKARTGVSPVIRQSHGGSARQARAVLEGLRADVVSLALASDVDALHEKAGLLPAEWRGRLPHGSVPYTSTVVFLVRKGNPKAIHDWDDLVRAGVQVVTPNPKTSGGARLSYLAAWGWGLRGPGGSEATARSFVARLYANVPVLDSGARGATTTFAERGIGDVLLAWESEALLARNELGGGAFEIVSPSVSILAEPPVALVDTVVDARGTRPLAQAYLDYLFTEEAQEIFGRHGFRPQSPSAASRHPLPEITLLDEDDHDHTSAQARHFGDGGIFDEIVRATGR